MNLDENLIPVNYRAVDRLLDQITPPLIPGQKVLTASFVNIDNVEESTTFGRTIAAQFASRLAHHDLDVVEMKLRRSVFIKKQGGEFILSRDLKDLSNEHNAPVVFVGTYSDARYMVYVSARAVSIADNTILASYDYKVPKGENIKQMLRQ